MKTINLNTLENVEVMLFPDNQPHVKIKNIEPDDYVDVICSITSSLRAIQLLEVSNAIDTIGARKHELYVPYLMGARYDRLMVAGDSIDLQVFAQIINLCNFMDVKILDAHSDISMKMILGSYNHIPNLLRTYNLENPIYICPDKGANVRLPKEANESNTVYCEKFRDLSTGFITLTVMNPELCNDRNCVIVDDICDGGRTFTEIAKQIKPKHLTLAITHGIFSKGLVELNKYFDRIITTNSLPTDSEIISESKDLRIINIY